MLYIGVTFFFISNINFIKKIKPYKDRKHQKLKGTRAVYPDNAPNYILKPPKEAFSQPAT